MENSIYNGKEICAFDLKDNDGYYNYDLVEEWKNAAHDRRLYCSDCGQGVYLAAGPIKEPYFAHYDKVECPYGNQIESEEMRKGKRLIYTLLKNSFPESDIRARYKMGNGKYSTCYVLHPDGQDIAIDYRLQYNTIDSFHERDTYYKENGIIPVYILGINKNNGSNQLSWYGNLIQKSTGLCIFLDAKNEKVVLKKSFDYRLGKQRIIKYYEKAYDLEGLIINKDGTFDCDFQEECIRILEDIQERKKAYVQNIEKQRIKNMSIQPKEEGLIRPDILRNAILCLERGEGHLVSKRYLDYINEHRLFGDKAHT